VATVEEGYGLTAGMPVARVGWLLAQARLDAHLSARQLAEAVKVPARTVKRWERGYEAPSDAEARRIAAACTITVEDLLPPRRIVALDLELGLLSVGERSVVIASGEGNESVLRQYLDLVSEQRSNRSDSMHLRHDDLVVLAAILDLNDSDLESRLVKLVGCTPDEAFVLRRRLLRHRKVARAAALALGLLAVIPVAHALDSGPATPASKVFGAGSARTELVATVVPVAATNVVTTGATAPANATTAPLPSVTVVVVAPGMPDAGPSTIAATPIAVSGASSASPSTTQAPQPAGPTVVTWVDELPPEEEVSSTTTVAPIEIGDAVVIVRDRGGDGG
jgi:transcriptional regulator with XRE-family HTH domain